jgi:hypothetical protein
MLTRWPCAVMLQTLLQVDPNAGFRHGIRVLTDLKLLVLSCCVQMDTIH